MKATVGFAIAILSLNLFQCSRVEAPKNSYPSSEVRYRTEIPNHEDLSFYQDYDLFSRRGHKEIHGDTLWFPFISEMIEGDSFVWLTYYQSSQKEFSRRIPLTDDYSYFSVEKSDCWTGNHYARLKGNQLIHLSFSSRSLACEALTEESYFLFTNPKLIIETPDTLYTIIEDCYVVDSLLTHKMMINNEGILPFLDQFFGNNDPVAIEEIGCETLELNYYEAFYERTSEVLVYKTKDLSTGEIRPSMRQGVVSYRPEKMREHNFWTGFGFY